MRIHEILSIDEAKRPTSLLYHGTSSTFVRSILKNGLDPNPNKKSWGDPETVGAAQESFPGVYVSPDIGYASRAARQAVKNHGGDPILVTVQYVEGSGGMDEDNISQVIAYYLSGKIEDGELNARIAYEDILSIMSEELVFTSMNRRSHEILKKLISSAIDIAKQFPDEVAGLEFDPIYTNPEIRRLLQQFTESVKMFPKNIKNRVVDPDEMFPKVENIKITRPIKYSGKTKIIKIENLKTNQIYYSAG